MADYNSLYQQGLYLSPNQQDLLLAALSSNNPPKQQNSSPAPKRESPGHASSGSFSVSPNDFDPSTGNGYDYGNDDSPFLDFNPDADFDFQGSESLIGDLPGSYLPDDYEPGDKRKDIEAKLEDDQGEPGKKRRESEDRTARKPGRKPLTSEPTTKRKAQNRAAQRAFRERKEKHVKDLETKVEELQKLSDSANQENGLLRAQVDRMQVELREYRKRLSWVTHGNGASAMSAYPGSYSSRSFGLNNSDFLFDFPKFGDQTNSHLFNGGQMPKNGQNKSQPAWNGPQVPGVLRRDALGSQASNHQPRPSQGSRNNSKSSNGTPQRTSIDPAAHAKQPTSQDHSTTDSPSSSSDSHQSQLLSSNGTSPESSPNFTDKDHNGKPCPIIDGEKSFCDQLGLACGNIKNPIPAVRHNSESASSTPAQPPAPTESSQKPFEPDLGLDFLSQQNGGQFDPVLFGDWREPQDAILSQDFGSFFNDAFPLPDLGSPSHNFTELANQPTPKKDLVSEMDKKADAEEVVPGEDKSQMLSCTKIWDRLQSMDKFRNGEIDVDNLCSELRTKARCSEGGVVVNQKDVDDIMGRTK